MPRQKTAAQAERERVQETERQRAHRIAAWARARNEGIREGLLMALTAILGQATGHGCGEAIKARGNRHFGDDEWQTKPRPG